MAVTITVDELRAELGLADDDEGNDEGTKHSKGDKATRHRYGSRKKEGLLIRPTK